ncbi:MAG: 30S ribosomal protein S18 [bacterium]
MAKKCRLCENKVKDLDYKDTSLLKGFINERGKILPARLTGLCALHQRRLAQAIKRAREIALLPYELK